MKKKICFISQFPPPIHGLSKAVDTLYHSFIQDEFDLEQIDITNNKAIFKNLKMIKHSNADLFYFTISQSKGGNLRDLLILSYIRRKKKRCLIHLHGGYYRNLIENDLSSWQRKANYKAISKLDGVIVLGNSLKNIFEGMIDSQKIFVVHNCVDNEFVMDKEIFEKKIKSLKRKDVRHVLYLSNFIKSKGYQYVLEMARMEKFQKNESLRLHFDFAGNFFDEEDRRYFFDFIKKYELEEYVTYHGVVKGKEKQELLAIGDFFVLLTRYPKEGQPISILEAMANGMGIVTTDHAGILDIVKDKENGIISYDEKDLSCLYQRMKDLTNEELLAIWKRNYEAVLREFSEEKYLLSMKEIFEEV